MNNPSLNLHSTQVHQGEQAQLRGLLLTFTALHAPILEVLLEVQLKKPLFLCRNPYFTLQR